MALQTLGTNANNTLTAIQYRASAVGGQTHTRTDFAALAALILDDRSSPMGQPAQSAPSAKPIFPGAFNPFYNTLVIPNRGVLKVLPGDWIGVDANGWPILVSRNAVAGGTSPSASTSWTNG